MGVGVRVLYIECNANHIPLFLQYTVITTWRVYSRGENIIVVMVWNIYSQKLVLLQVLISFWCEPRNFCHE